MTANPDQAPAASLLEISRVLEETTRIVRQHAGAAQASEDGEEAITAAYVRTIIAIRWMRRRYLRLEAADAAWSMMLELKRLLLIRLSDSAARRRRAYLVATHGMAGLAV